jgi:hypothetical protein
MEWTLKAYLTSCVTGWTKRALRCTGLITSWDGDVLEWQIHGASEHKWHKRVSWQLNFLIQSRREKNSLPLSLFSPFLPGHLSPCTDTHFHSVSENRPVRTRSSQKSIRWPWGAKWPRPRMPNICSSPKYAGVAGKSSIRCLILWQSGGLNLISWPGIEPTVKIACGTIPLAQNAFIAEWLSAAFSQEQRDFRRSQSSRLVSMSGKQSASIHVC